MDDIVVDDRVLAMPLAAPGRKSQLLGTLDVKPFSNANSTGGFCDPKFQTRTIRICFSTVNKSIAHIPSYQDPTVTWRS
jgi:hypothetical protein